MNLLKYFWDGFKSLLQVLVILVACMGPVVVALAFSQHHLWLAILVGLYYFVGICTLLGWLGSSKGDD